MIDGREQFVRKVPVVGAKKGKRGQVENWWGRRMAASCIKITAICLPPISHRTYSSDLIPSP
jgi:hypothetical protein